MSSSYQDGTYRWNDREFADFLYSLGAGADEVYSTIGVNQLFEVKIELEQEKIKYRVTRLDEIPSQSFGQLTSEHIGIACSRRVGFLNYLEAFDSCRISYEDGECYFSNTQDPYSESFQILGRYYEVEQLWVWEWEHSRPFIPEESVELAHELREWGEREQIAEFTRATWRTDLWGCFQVAAIASGYCGYAPVIPHQLGECVVFLLFDSPPVDALLSAPPQVVQNVILEIDNVFSNKIDLRHAIRSYLQFEQYSLEETQSSIKASAKNNREIMINFSSDNELVELNANRWNTIDWCVSDYIWLPNSAANTD